jgi:C-terminal processing protease CtpA/Prc
VPVPLRFVEGQFVVDELPDSTVRDPAGLLSGDAIVALDGVPVADQVPRWLPYYGASNEDAARRDIARVLTQGPCGPVRVRRDRGGNLDEITLLRVDPSGPPPRMTHDRPGATFRRVSNDLAYLKLSSVEAKDTADYVRQAEGARLLVIDVRNYPNSFVVFALGQHLVATKTEFVTFTSGDLANPGAFAWTPPLTIEPKEPRFTGQVALLVDETTQSSAEYTALALRSAPGAIVVGSTTAGADGNVSPVPLPGGLRAMISGIGVFTADRRPTQRVGIVPDLVVRPTRAGLSAGRDEVLEAAVERVLGRSLTAPEFRGLALRPIESAGSRRIEPGSR